MDPSSYHTLKQRWSNVELLRRGATLRDHLSSPPLHFGQMDQEKHYIISLLPQAHNAYYMGHLEACIAMCGSLLEAFFAKIIAEQECNALLHSQNQGHDTAKNRNTEIIEDVQNLGLNGLIKIVRDKHWLNVRNLSLLHNIKDLRNRTLHGCLPLFEYQSQAEAYICSLAYGHSCSREITIPEGEVIDIDEPIAQITAWYCLKYSRYILHQLLNT